MTTFFRGRRCVITGGGSGIGLETARLLAAKGAQPLLWDLDAAALAAAAAELSVPTQVLDVTDADAVAQAMEAAAGDGGLQGVIHCAGLSQVGMLAGTDLAAARRVIDVNLFGTVAVAQAALPHLQHSGGSLVLVASVAAFYGAPDWTVYGASKAAILNLAQGLRIETAGTGVHVAVICPHFADTPMYRRHSVRSRQAHRRSVFVELQGPEVVAAAILRGMERRQFMLWTGWRPRVIFWLTRYANWLAHPLMSSASGPPLEQQGLSE